MLGLGLPQGENLADDILVKDEFWRVCYGAPIVLTLIGMGLLMTVFPEESINYSIQKGNKDEALSLISKLYMDDPLIVYQKIESTTLKEDKDSATFYEALTAPEYRTATWFCFILTIFHQYCGLNAIFIYSHTMATKLNEQGKFPLTPTEACYGMGVCFFVGALLGP